MIDEIALLLSHASKQLIQTCTIVEFIKKADKEIDVTGCVDKMPSRAFVLRTPDLDGKCLGEDLRQLLLRCSSCCSVLLIVVDDMGSLGKLAGKIDMDGVMGVCTLALMR